MMDIAPSRRLAHLGSAIFAEVAQWKAQAAALGKDVIDLGIGSPDRPPSREIMDALRDAVTNPALYGYPGSAGTLRFRKAVAGWYSHRFAVELDPDREVLALMGSQDGLAHLALAVTDPGDTALVPDPGYPIYAAGLVIAGVVPHFMPLTAENGYLPDLDGIPEETAAKAKFMLLNYPSNPLSAVADLAFFERLVEYACRHNILIVHDLAYSEMAFDGYRPPSVLQVPGAMEVAVEFHSMSKSFNLAGCRIAFLAGHPGVIRALGMLKSNIDYGVFLAVQEAAAFALEADIANPNRTGELYERRRDVLAAGLARAGWDVPKPKATMFVWAPVPDGGPSRVFARDLLLGAGVAVIPGDAFGSRGEGFVRIALVQEEDRLRDAAERVGRFLGRR